MITGFTLDLRQRNSLEIEANNLTLPTLQIQTVLQHMDQSILAELGDHDNLNRDATFEAGNNGDLALGDELADDVNDSESI